MKTKLYFISAALGLVLSVSSNAENPFQAGKIVIRNSRETPGKKAIANTEKSELPDSMIWQDFKVPMMDCAAAQKLVSDSFAISGAMNSKITTWSTMICPQLGLVEYVTLVEHYASEKKAYDAEVSAFMERLRNKFFFDQKVQVYLVKEVIAVNELSLEYPSIAEGEDPAKDKYFRLTLKDRPETYKTYVDAVEGFTTKGKPFLTQSKDEFYTTLNAEIGNSEKFQDFINRIDSTLPSIRITGGHSFLISDGRVFEFGMSPYFERDCSLLKCM